MSIIYHVICPNCGHEFNIDYSEWNSLSDPEVGIIFRYGSDINVTLKKIQDALNRGYKRIKVKIMKGKETQILGAVRDQFPDIILSPAFHQSIHAL